MDWNWMASSAGLAIGALVGMTGLGGGAIMTPFLILGLGVSPVVAVGTDLVWLSITKVIGTWQHARQGGVDFTRLRWLVAGGLPGTLLGTMALRSAHAEPNLVVTYMLGPILVVAALGLLVRPGLRTRTRGKSPFESPWLLAGAGFLTGTLTVTTSVGGGSLLLVLLALGTAMTTAQLVGTGMAFALGVGVIGAFTHIGLGNVSWSLVASLLLGSIPGVWVGSRISVSVPEQWVRYTMAALLVGAGVKMVAV